MQQATRRHHRYDSYARETFIASIWTALIAALVIAAAYHRSGPPGLDAIAQAGAPLTVSPAPVLPNRSGN